MNVLASYLSANRCVQEEYDGIPLEMTSGALPEALVGTLFRNGNGRFVHQGIRYDHLFDGDGMVSSFVFTGDRVLYRNRYVRTSEFVAEERAGRMLYRSFGTNLPGGMRRNFLKMRFKNAANTSVIYHGEKLLALWEGGLPHELDPVTLHTKSRYHFDGVLLNNFSAVDRLIQPELPFSAHPKINPDTGELFNFGTAPGLKQRLVIYRVSPEGRAEIANAIPIPEVVFAHDFILTATNKLVFFLTPVSFQLMRAFAGLETPVSSIKVDQSKPTKIVVVDGDQWESYETDFCFVFHFTNGFEDKDGHLVVDALTMPDFPSAEMSRKMMAGIETEAPQGQLMRYRIDRASGEVTHHTISKQAAELPDIHPDLTGKPYRYVWSIGNPPDSNLTLLHSLLKIDLTGGPNLSKDFYPSLPGEPIMAPKPNAQSEDDGWLVFLLFHPERQETELLVAEATNLDIVARARLPHNIPLGFHGCWSPEVFV